MQVPVSHKAAWATSESEVTSYYLNVASRSKLLNVQVTEFVGDVTAELVVRSANLKTSQKTTTMCRRQLAGLLRGHREATSHLRKSRILASRALRVL